MTEKLVCHESHCGWHGTDDKALRATSPFDPKDTLMGCPDCKAVNQLYVACDEPGCWKEATCGFVTSTGYRRTCGKHQTARSA